MAELIIIDTSAMLFGFSNHVNVFDVANARFGHAKLLSSSSLVHELAMLGTNKGRKGSHARLALSILRSKKINADNTNKAVDDWIVASAKKHHGLIVITNDNLLAIKLKSIGAAVYKLSRSGSLR